MTNVSATPEKVATRRGLFHLAERALEAQGWKVSRVRRGGKSSLREITRGNETKRVSIRTSQDTAIAFPRRGNGWVTLDDVDFVVAASVNDKDNPTEARVHLIPGDDARDRFNRAYAARKAAKHSQPDGHGIWLSLYDREAKDPVHLVGAGMGLAHPPLIVHDLTKEPLPIQDDAADDGGAADETSSGSTVPLATKSAEGPLSIPEAKRRLALTLGVPESAIRITVEH